MLHANVVESTEHAQKHTAAKNRKREESNKGKPLNTGNREEEIIDLNEVLHQLKGSSTRADNGESRGEASSKPSGDTSLKVTDVIGESKSDLPLPLDGDLETDDYLMLTSSEDEMDSGSVNLDDISENKSVWPPEEEERSGLGLIGFQDNIPDDVFERMIAGELDPWGTHDVIVMSHDTANKLHINDDDKQDDEIGGDGEIQSHDIKTQSHDIKAQSHDVKYLRQMSGSKLVALILAPTRELAIQVHDHLTAAAKYTNIKVHVRLCLVQIAVNMHV